MKELYKTKEECCGCSACVNICHKNAIHMEKDSKGFLYPVIEKSLCVNCGLCEKVCPLKEKEASNLFEKKAYGVKNKNEKERFISSSGGVFIEAAKYFLKNNGVIYGVELTSDFKVKHGRAISIEDTVKFQGSKYVQSEKNDIFQLVQKDLNQGKNVLFTGTPCEIAGLKKFLIKNYNNLYTLDLICHGVPSMKLLEIFLKQKENENLASIDELKFRDKTYGWRNQEIYIKFKNGKIYHAPIWEDNFYRLFTSNYILRDSCYSCHFANIERKGDITIGDFWNIKSVNELFEDKLGVSSIIINSKKGQELFDKIRNNFEIIECSIDEVIQPNLKAPSSKPEGYEKFHQECTDKSFEYCLKKYGTLTFNEKIRRKLSPIKQKLKKIIGK